MEIVTVSPKYQVVIPLALRKALGIKPGQKIEVRERDGKLELSAVKPISAYRGFLRDIDTDIPNDPE